MKNRKSKNYKNKLNFLRNIKKIDIQSLSVFSWIIPKSLGKSHFLLFRFLMSGGINTPQEIGVKLKNAKKKKKNHDQKLKSQLHWKFRRTKNVSLD